ncbi:hypothetical protein K438DRAFT_1976048 [Mycena galopus ATCC 62051]|nr:hypothetical protein K438DRAFT_1976048 [Mycena galopus ATCC 62051]
MTTSFSGHCGQCGPGVCVGYSPLLDGHPCLCGHAESLHALEQAVILPPTGPCLESGCIRFQSTTVLCGNPGHTPCQRPGCGHVYVSHLSLRNALSRNPAPAVAQNPAPAPAAPAAPLPPTSTLSTVPSQAPPHSIWGRLDSVQTADGCRRVAAVRHRQFTPGVGASMPRTGHRPYTMTTTSRISSQSIKPPRELTFAIWPFAMWDPMLADAEYPELYPMDFRLVGSERSSLATVLRQHDLLFKFQVPVKLDGSEDTDAVFYAELNTRVKDHMAKHHLRFSRFTPTDLPELPHTTDVELINAQHVERLDAIGWTVLVAGIKPKSAAFERKINSTSIRWYHFKLSAFSDRHYWAPIADPANPNQHIYFIGPKHGPLEGPLLGMSVPHMCFPLRVQHELEVRTGHSRDPVECFDLCPRTTKARPALATALVPVRSTVTLLDAAANDSDEEADQLRQALALSVADAVPPPSTEAGPSSRPVSSLLAPRRARPASLNSPSPPSTCRRLDAAETIDLTTSPSPVAVDIEGVDEDSFPDAGRSTQSRFASVRAWSQALQPRLDTEQCRLTTPTVEAGVKALLTHFESFYGGNEYVAENQVDAVQIEPSGEFGLLARHGTWKSGTALGPGVSRAIMSELMKAVFADAQIWKNMGDGTCVVNVSPPGIQPDAQRLRHLSAHGYACRLYVITQGALPPNMSVLFAYTLLSTGRDNHVISNPSDIRMFAPHHVPLLQRWPKVRSKFLEKQTEPELMELVNSYFNMLPKDIAKLSDDMFQSYTNSFTRQVVFGCQTLFSESPEITAFAVGFNGPISSSFTATLSETFGASLKSLLLKMSAGRIQKPEDVIERLAWTYTGDEQFSATEARYRMAFIRYLSGQAVVKHPRLPIASLTAAEREIPDDHPLARALMFLMYATGSQLLPKNNSKIDMVFIKDYGPSAPGAHIVNPEDGDPAHNPEHWADHVLAVRGHTCFDGVDLPLLGPAKLLEEPIPPDNTSTDFDLYQYIMYRPTTICHEFGGIQQLGRLSHAISKLQTGDSVSPSSTSPMSTGSSSLVLDSAPILESPQDSIAPLVTGNASNPMPFAELSPGADAQAVADNSHSPLESNASRSPDPPPLDSQQLNSPAFPWVSIDVGDMKPSETTFKKKDTPRQFGMPPGGILPLEPPWDLFKWAPESISTAGKPDVAVLKPAPAAPPLPPGEGTLPSAPEYTLNEEIDLSFRRGFYYAAPFYTSNRKVEKEDMLNIQSPPNIMPKEFDIKNR